MIRFLQYVCISKKFMVFIAFAAPKNVDALFSWVTALFFSLQNGQTGPISLLSLSDHFARFFPRAFQATARD
jgi:hypothetical protein